MKTVLAEACKLGQPVIEMFTLFQLAELRKAQGRTDDARDLFEKGDRRAADLGAVDQIFDCAYELMLLSHGRDATAHHRYRRRCHRYYPMLRARTQRVVAFEASMKTSR